MTQCLTKSYRISKVYDGSLELQKIRIKSGQEMKIIPGLKYWRMTSSEIGRCLWLWEITWLQLLPSIPRFGLLDSGSLCWAFAIPEWPSPFAEPHQRIQSWKCLSEAWALSRLWAFSFFLSAGASHSIVSCFKSFTSITLACITLLTQSSHAFPRRVNVKIFLINLEWEFNPPHHTIVYSVLELKEGCSGCTVLSYEETSSLKRKKDRKLDFQHRFKSEK